MPSERFEMRMDSELLERLDRWRRGEDDSPSRAEAIRRLLEAGLAHDNQGRAPHLGDGEKLIAFMLADLIKASGARTETDADFIQKVIAGGHYWALAWELPGIFHGHADRQKRVRLVVDVLEMWSFLEEAYERLDDAGRARLAAEAGAWGRDVHFPGFDGNDEGEYLGIARFLVEDLRRFSRFREDGRDLNSNFPTLEKYRAMLATFEQLRKTLVGRHLTLDELIAVLDAQKRQ